MSILTVNYFDATTLSKQNTKTQLQSHFNLITASILQCKELSNAMPIRSDGFTLANDTLLDTLECNTSTRYKLDGGKGSFIPTPLNKFTAYKATQVINEFYFTTTTDKVSNNYEVLQELKNNFSSQQYELSDDGTTATLKFYLSR